MKIGMLIPAFPAQTHVFFWREIKALEAEGVAVQVLSTRRPPEPCPHDFATEGAARTRYMIPPRVTSLPRAFARDPLGLALVTGYLRSLSVRGRQLVPALVAALCAPELVRTCREQGIDHIHVHSCADAAHLVAIARLLGGPTFSLHLHGDLPVYGTDHRQKAKRALFVAAAARPMQQQLVDEAGVPPQRTCTMIMGVDVARFTARPPTPRSGPLHVVTVSRLSFTKGHAHALAGMRRAIDDGVELRYSIAGSGPDRALIEADIERLGLRDHVTFLGSLGERQVVDLLQRADVFLLASIGKGEASPVAVMEAMASGVAVVCSRIGGTGDMITDGEDGFLVAQKDEAAIAAALKRLHDDDSLRIRIAHAARARAERQFDARALARSFIDTVGRHKASQP